MLRSRHLILTPSMLLLAGAISAAEQPAPAPQPVPAVDAAPVPAATSAGTIEVTGKHDTDVYSGSASTANKGAIPTLESPRRVDVITRDIIRDLDATTATELWRLVPNAVESERGTVIVRGFTLDQRPASGAQLFDGVRTSVYNLVPVSLYNVERVEVLKGPDGVMYGQGQPGGMVNYVYKKPQAEERNEVSAKFDSYGKKQFTTDSTGTLANTSAGDFLFRLNTTGEQTETFRNYEQFKNFRISPAVTWEISDQTKITLLSEWFKDRRTGGRGYGTPVRKGDPFAMPLNYTIADPNDFRETYGGWGQLQVDHKLTKDLQLSANVFASECKYWNQYHEGQRSVAEVVADNPVFQRQYRDQRSDTKTIGYDTHAVWDAGTDNVAHRLLVGTDFSRIIDPQFPAIDARTTNSYNAATNPNGASALNLNNPYALPGGTGNYVVNSGEEAHGTLIETGGYTNYRIGFAKQLFLDAGVRYDDFQQHAWSWNTLTNAQNFDVESHDHSMVYDGGIVWKFVETASLYYGYSNGLQSQGYTTIGNVNGPFDPLTWNQHEVGLSTETPGRDLGASICAFRLTRVHDLTSDPNDPTGKALIDVGETRSEGIEAGVRGKIMRNTVVSASYGYLNARVRETNAVSAYGARASLQGETLAGVPSQTANVTLAHTLNAVPVRLFADWTYTGARKALLDPADPRSFDLPQYYLIDIGATYIQPSWQARLGVNNVLDRDYAVLYRATGHQVNRGDPQTFTVTFTGWF